MLTFDVRLGAQDAMIFAPERGTFDLAAFRAVFPYGQLYGLDVESTYMDDLGQWGDDFTVRLIQFATVGYAWVLDMGDPDQVEAARNLLADETTTFTSHSNMDVLSVYRALDVDISSRNVDTLVLANMAYTDRMGDRDLKTLTTELIGPELTEAETALHKVFHILWTESGGKKNAAKKAIETLGWKTIDPSFPEYLRYAGLDAIACRRLVELLIPLTGAPARLLEIETWLAGEANRIQMRGFVVDQRLLEELETEAGNACRAAEDRVVAVSGLKVRSIKLKDWYTEHGVDWSTWGERGGNYTDKGSPSLAKESMKVLGTYELDVDGREVFEAQQRFQEHADRVLKTKGVREHLCKDGRIRPVLKTNGATQTSRMSSAGPNMQNFSKKDPRTRGMFIPEPHSVLVSCDFDQVELRVVAALANERVMIDAILRGDDLHSLTTKAIFPKLDFDSMPEDVFKTKYRPIGKMTNFLMVYGGGAQALYEQGGVPIEEGREVIRNFKESYQSIADLNEYMMGFTSTIRTVSGRRLEVGRLKDGRPRSYANINYLVQSSARDLLVDAWYRFAVEYGRADTVWYPVHDELVLQVPEAELEEVMAEVEKCMTFDFLGVPITATASVLRDANGVSRWGK